MDQTQILEDKYILGQSNNQQLLNVGEEIRLDLSLLPNTNSVAGGIVSGIVSDSANKPIKNALVKIMDTNYNPLFHVKTDDNGNYLFRNLPEGSYDIFAISDGMKLSQGNQFSIKNYQNLTINLSLQINPNSSFGLIAGDLNNLSTNSPISGAVVSLYLVENDKETLQSMVYSNKYGQYVFTKVPKGKYLIKVTSLGYDNITALATILQDGQIIPLNLTMIQNDITSKGTVSGTITNNNNEPIANADVILYRVNLDRSLTPVAFTSTNINGIYLFANVAQGNYKVKSNQSTLINITI